MTVSAPARPEAVYVYVDTAFGGVNRRNHVKRLDQVYVNGTPDCYASHLRATEELVHHCRTHTNKKGNPTVERFTGRVWTDSLHLDFDYQPDPSRALVWLQMVLDRLEAEDVPLDAIRVYFSGGKGFHAEIPHTLFGGFEPSTALHVYLKRAAVEIMGAIPFDHKVYDKLRLWRLPNTRHGKTNRYKIQLTLREVRSFSMREIDALAVRPRDARSVPGPAPVPDDEWAPNEYLVGVWRRAQVETPRSQERRRGMPNDEARDHLVVASIAASWPHGLVGISRHSDYLLPLAGFLANHLDGSEIADILKEAARSAGDASFLNDHTRDWEAEIDRMAESSDAEVRDGVPVVGLPTLAEHWPQLADVLAALWPETARLRVGQYAGEGASGTSGTDSEGDTSSDRPEPDPVFGLPPAPALPLDALPEEIARVARDVADRQQAPADFAAWALLTSSATLIGRAAGIRPRALDDWTERLALFVALIGSPSSMKTPSLEEGIRPVNRQQAKDQERYDAELALWKQEARNAKEAGEEVPPEPVLRRSLTSDSTVEKLATLIGPSRGLVVYRDELAGVILGMDRYCERGGDRQFYLQAYSGGVYAVDRIARGTLFVKDLLFNIIGGIQPAVARSIFGEGPEDGLAARFISVWPDVQGWEHVDRWPSKLARDALDEANDRLIAADWKRELLTDDFKPTPFCRLEEAGQQLFNDWHAVLMRRLRSTQDLGRLEARMGKYPGVAARLMLLFHLIEWAAGRAQFASKVTAVSVENVLRLMDTYLEPMDRRVYAAYAIPAAAEGGRRIARWIEQARPDQLTAREIQRHHWSGLQEPPAVAAALDWLVTHRWLREAPAQGRPGRPSAVYVVNPRIWEAGNG